MPRNGSGTYSLPPGINPVVTQTLITSNWANTTLSDIANALTGSLARDGQSLPTANLPLGGFRFTGAGDPQGLQDFMTLSFSQQGLHTRLTNVSGINGITANLPGGSTSFAVGQLVQLLPAATNTGAVTISINGSPAAPILSAQGQQLGATNLTTGQVYLLSWNGSAWNILTSPDITSFAQSAISGWFRPGPSLPYPDVTQVNSNTIAIPAGSGRIIAPSTRDITGVINVSWPAQNYVLQNIATQWETTIGINASGQVVEFIGNVNSAWARNNIILCTVGHINGSIQFISNKPLIFGDVSYMAYDLGILFHNTLVKGGRVTGNVGNPIHLDIAAGTLWIVGGNADQQDSPNLLNFPAIVNANFWPVTTTLVGAITQNVPVGSYDPGGAGPIVPIPGGGATSVIHRLYLLAGQLVFSYGQFTYGSLDDAANNLARDDTAFTPPSKLVDATFVAWIVARKDATNLNDPAQARLINAGSAGGGGGGGGGGSGIPDAPLTGQTFGRNNGVWVLAVDEVQAGQNVTVDSSNPNKPIVNVPSGNLTAGSGISLAGTLTNRLVGAVGNVTVSALSQGDGDLVQGRGAVLTGTLADRLVGAGNVTVTGGGVSMKNRLINADFYWWQRATSLPALANTLRWAADRWSNSSSAGTTLAVSRQNFALGQTDIPDDPIFFHRTAVVTSGAAGSSGLTAQAIEDVHSISGDYVLSFWAKADAARPISIEFVQNFGSGGSPILTGIGVQKINLTTAWQKFTIPVTVPSLAGKVLGGNNSFVVNFWYDAGSNFNARTNSLGTQSGTFDIARVQLERGSVATEFDWRNPGQELELCQRYFEISYQPGVLPGTATYAGATSYFLDAQALTTGRIFRGTSFFRVSKRVTPTVVVYSPDNGAANFVFDFNGGGNLAATISFQGQGSFNTQATQTINTGRVDAAWQWTAEAELT